MIFYFKMQRSIVLSFCVICSSEQYDVAYERISMMFNAALWYMKHAVKYAANEEQAFVAHCLFFSFFLFCFIYLSEQQHFAAAFSCQIHCKVTHVNGYFCCTIKRYQLIVILYSRTLNMHLCTCICYFLKSFCKIQLQCLLRNKCFMNR